MDIEKTIIDSKAVKAEIGELMWEAAYAFSVELQGLSREARFMVIDIISDKSFTAVDEEMNCLVNCLAKRIAKHGKGDGKPMLKQVLEGLLITTDLHMKARN